MIATITHLQAAMIPLSFGAVIVIGALYLKLRGITLVVYSPHQAHPPGSSQNGRHRASRLSVSRAGSHRPSLPPQAAALCPSNTSVRTAIGRLLQACDDPEVQKAMHRIWQKDDMRRQLHCLRRHRSALQESAWDAGLREMPPFHPARAESEAADLQRSVASSPSTDSTIA